MNKKCKLIICAVIFVCSLIAIYVIIQSKLSKSISNPAAIVVADYDVSKLGGDFLMSENSAYDIGANIYGKPIFKDTDAAFKAIKNDYSTAIKYIRSSFHLPALNKNNYELYKTYGCQVVSDDEELLHACIQISAFFDIYENSFQ